MLTLTSKHQLPLTHHLPLQHRMGGYAPATNRFMTAYLATKAGANSYAMGTRAVLAAAGVGVTLACPGFVRSRMTKELGEQGVQFYGLWSTERAVDAISAGAARNVRAWSVFYFVFYLRLDCGKVLSLTFTDYSKKIELI